MHRGEEGETGALPPESRESWVSDRDTPVAVRASDSDRDESEVHESDTSVLDVVHQHPSDNSVDNNQEVPSDDASLILTLRCMFFGSYVFAHRKKK